MKSTLTNMVSVLFLITLIASGAVAAVYQLTKEPIAAAKAAKDASALRLVLPEFDNEIMSTRKRVAIDGDSTTMYTAEKAGVPVGYAIQTYTTAGFSGLITLMVGFTPEGAIHGIEVLQHAETPGLGSKMTDPGNVLTASFEGKNAADLKMSVRKDGGDIDALTASTITSRAYTDAVERAWRVFQTEVQGAAVEQRQPVDPLKTLFPDHDNDPAAEKTSYKNDIEAPVDVFPMRKGGESLGYVLTTSARGYNYDVPIELAVGFAPDGTIVDIVVTKQAETEGYGAQIMNADNPLTLSYKGKKSTDEIGVQAITGATLTSEAYAAAVESTRRIFNQITREDAQ